MKITKWVEFNREVEISLGTEDISALLAESLATDRQGTVQGILYAVNSIASFLRAVGDEQIAAMLPAQRATISRFFAVQAERFQMREPAAGAAATDAAPNKKPSPGGEK